MKNFLKKICYKIKQYRLVIIMFLIILALNIISDGVFGGFDTIKYIAYSFAFHICYSYCRL